MGCVQSLLLAVKKNRVVRGCTNFWKTRGHTQIQRFLRLRASTCVPGLRNPCKEGDRSGGRQVSSASLLQEQETGRKTHPVETSMTLGQLRRIPSLLNRKPTRSIRSLEVLEPVDGDPRRSRGELQQTGFALGRPAADALPEPLDHLLVHLVSAVVCEFYPVVSEEE